MPALYPDAIRNFGPDRQDNIDTVEDVDVNHAWAEITAIATTVGVNPNVVPVSPSVIATPATVSERIQRVEALLNAQSAALASSPTCPPGSIVMFGGNTGSPPTGWLDCDGSAVSRTTYAALFAAIGTHFGTGNGTTTFNVPNLINRFAQGAGSGGPGIGVTDSGTGHDHSSTTSPHTLLVAEIPAHKHLLPSHNHNHAIRPGIEDPGHAHGDAFAHSFSAGVAGTSTRVPASSTPTSGSDATFSKTTDGAYLSGGGITTSATDPASGYPADRTQSTVLDTGDAITSGGGHTHGIPAQGPLKPPSVAVGFIIRT